MKWMLIFLFLCAAANNADTAIGMLMLYGMGWLIWAYCRAARE